MSTDNKNPHAAQIEGYCQDWQETDKPWERWAARLEGATTWKACSGHPSWLPGWEYRRKPDTIKVNGIKCDAPLKAAPPIGTVYFLANFDDAMPMTWDDSEYDHDKLAEGIACATKEDAQALWLAMTAPLRAYVNGGGK